MPNGKKDWELVNAITSGEKNIENKQLSQKSIANSISVRNDFQKPEGIISNYKAKSIARSTSIQLMKQWYSAQLQVTKHQLEKAVEVKNKEIDADVEKLLAEINKRHLCYLMELEFSNVQEKQKALDKLGSQTAETLERLQSRDWPKHLREQMINGVIELNQRFFDKIMQE